VYYDSHVPQIISSSEFDAWLAALKDKSARGRILARIVRLEAGNFGDAKHLKAGVSELRLDFGPGYRLYFTRRGKSIVILLCAGDKSSQTGDIQRAKQIAAEFKE
jgi:putative addiction module killer protein